MFWEKGEMYEHYGTLKLNNLDDELNTREWTSRLEINNNKHIEFLWTTPIVLNHFPLVKKHPFTLCKYKYIDIYIYDKYV